MSLFSHLKKEACVDAKIAPSGSSAPIIQEPWNHLNEYFIQPTVLKLMPKPFAVKNLILPLCLQAEVLHVAMTNPQAVAIIDEIRRLAKVRAIIPHPANREEILGAIDRNYGLLDEVKDIVQEIRKEKAEEKGSVVTLGKEELESGSGQAPIVKLVNHIVMQAIQEKCSDIHVEPDDKVLRIRFRRDGMLHEAHTFAKELESGILSRMKIMAGMDIAEKRKPQDGRIKILLESKKIDVRVSALPTLYGENIVLRLLDKTTVSRDLAELGMGGRELQEFRRLIHLPHGIILVTGPTGSGKSTTLYAALSEINSIEKNIVTIEDPIEYDIELIRQTQVNPKIRLTFANGLRSILRQDPDVIMVGEIRDVETADIAVQAALTGHLVLSTLHTNDACGAVIRLMDMDIPPFLIASSVIGVLAQRLIRKICEHCKRPAKVPEILLEELKIKEKGVVFYEGQGCEKCRQLKYFGRTAIHELFVMSDGMRELITQRATDAELTQLAKKQGMKTLHQSAVEKAVQGITSLEEVLKVTKLE
jgi:type II secretion system protein E